MAAISVSTAPGVRNNDFKRKKQIVSDDGMQQYKALEMDIIVGKLYARYTGAKVRNWSTKISHDKWVLFFYSNASRFVDLNVNRNIFSTEMFTKLIYANFM